MKKSQLRQIIKEEISKVLERSQHEINFKPMLGVDHYIEFKNPKDSGRKLRDEGIEFEQVTPRRGVNLTTEGFIFPKLSYETWYGIKELFVQEDIRGIGQY